MANEVLDNGDAALAGARPGRKPLYFLKYGGLGKLALLASVLVVTLAACSNGNAASNAAPQAAYNFPFTLYQGESELGASNLELSDLRGKPVVLNFWAGLCPPCRAEMPDFQLFYEEFKDKVTLIGIDIGQYTGLGTQNDARNLLNELGVTYPAGFTDDSRVVRRYEVLAMPTTVFINSKGEVFKKWGGILNRRVLTDVSNEMLALESG